MMQFCNYLTNFNETGYCLPEDLSVILFNKPSLLNNATIFSFSIENSLISLVLIFILGSKTASILGL